MKRTTTLYSAVLAAVVAACAVGPAAASPEGRRNTAIGLTAASIYALTQDKDTIGLAGAAGSAYAWHQYNKSRNEQVAKRSYRSGYAAARRSSPSRSYTTSRTVRYAAPARTAAVRKAVAPAAPKQVSQIGRDLLPQQESSARVAQAASYVPGYVMVPATAAMVSSATYPVAQVHPASYSVDRPMSDGDGSSAAPWLVGLSAFALGVGGTLAATSRRRSDVVTLGARRTV